MVQQTEPIKTIPERINYYANRVNDPSLSQGKRNWAAKRLSELTSKSNSGGKSKPSCSVPSGTSNTTKYTDGQKYAYGAGIGFAKAKAGERVDVKPENKQSFREGYDYGKRRKKK